MKATHNVVRDINGNGAINYGELSLCELGGIQFVTDPYSAKDLGARIVECDDIPPFIRDATIRFNKSPYSKKIAYVLKREDIRTLGETISRIIPSGASAEACVRVYAVWKDGKLTKEPRLMSSFYSNFTPEEDELYRLK